MTPEFLIAIVAVTAVLVVAAALIVVSSLIEICLPNEMLVLIGKAEPRLINAGRAVRMPVIEQAQRMPLSGILVEAEIQAAYSKGGIPINLSLVAIVSVSDLPPVFMNAVERFLGSATSEIARVAKETIEGHARGLAAELTPEELHLNRMDFAARLRDEADPDFEQLGLQLRELLVERLADDRDYLSSIGREKVAAALSAAQVARGGGPA